MAESPKPSKLDLLHKGIYPALGIVIAIFGLSLHLANSDKQRQLNEIQVKLHAMEDRWQAAELEHVATAEQAEEKLNQMRVALCKWLLPDESAANNDLEREQRRYARVRAAFLIADLESEDAKRMGEEQAKQIWKRARTQAEKLQSPRKLDWTF